ncbi:MAG TPA: phosphate ABC transporter permease subunit PstC [Solirubrobacteraceae bacterium]|nr:phosphate ABC transporter permease subunit PstC [Solirubrobacteraceae bacterium]
MLYAACALAGLSALALVAEIVRELVRGAAPAISRYGLAFVLHSRWAPNFGRFGGAQALYGTGMTSAIALALAAPIGLAIGLYLAVLAPSGVRAVVGPLVELLAAIPSVIVGFWGVDVLAPFVAHHLEGPLHAALGGIPLFGAPQTTGLSVFTAGLTLALMVVPIVAALSRDLFATVPRELTDGAAALGATRWEVIRGVVLPATASGLAAAIVLGLGRALGEAIAVLQVIGDGEGIHASLFLPGNALAPRIAQEFISPVGNEIPALFYLGLILLAIELSISLIARWIGRRFDVTRALST